LTPWEIVECLHATENPLEILGSLDQADPFWCGASYAIDPFVGIIVRLPLRRDPQQYGNGIHPETFERLVKPILDGQLTGDRLVMGIEALSKYCREDEWVLWYKRILQGEMSIPICLDDFNEFCPDQYKIRPVRLHKPKNISSLSDLPSRFFIQPLYPTPRVFWMIDSTHTPIEIRCYDEKLRRVHNVEVEESLIEMARKQPMNIVLFGHMGQRGFIADDILTHDQFAQERGAPLLYRRLMGLAQLGIQTAQMSPLITPQTIDRFYKEFDLVLQQGFVGVIIRDLEGYYPFREKSQVQPDILVRPSIKSVVTCRDVIPDVGIKAETMRGKKTVKAIVRVGLTESIWKDISESSVGRRLEVLSCGQNDGEILLPVFQGWK
jgi:hypothetical protein